MDSIAADGHKRIVSLIASATEIVSALGYEESLVGISHECDFPDAIIGRPVCSEPRINVHASSGEIDLQVRETVREVLSVYNVFHEELDRLEPNLVITQSQCDVCAVNLRDVEAAVQEMVASKPQIVALEPMQLSDIWLDIQRVADAIGDPSAGQQLTASLQSRLNAVKQAATQRDHTPVVFCLEWLEPLMAAANWVPELVSIAGGQSAFGQAGKHSGYLTWSDVVAKDPDVIAIMPCGFGVERTMQEIHLLTEHTDWSSLKAVRNGRVYVTDGNHYFNRPGPRVVESAEILSEILHGNTVGRSHEDTAWIRLQ